MTTYDRARGAARAVVDGETVVLSPQDLRYHRLNSSASALWDLLAAPATAEALVDQLLERFEVDRATCAADVDKALALMTDLGLIVEV